MNTSSNRRTFVKHSSTLLAGIGLSAISSLPYPESPLKEPHIELAIATICLDGFGDENFENVFKSRSPNWDQKCGVQCLVSP